MCHGVLVAECGREKKSRRKEKTDDKKFNPNACPYCGALKHCRCGGGEIHWFGERDEDEEADYQLRLVEARRAHDEVCSCNKRR